jgi:hypothetical protein
MSLFQHLRTIWVFDLQCCCQKGLIFANSFWALRKFGNSCKLQEDNHKSKNLWRVELIEFWMAHGILQSHENQELEDVGNLYIKELWSRSFFQDVDMRNFLYYTFKMHNLVHDLALSIAQGECSIVTKKSTIGGKVHHFHLHIKTKKLQHT